MHEVKWIVRSIIARMEKVIMFLWCKLFQATPGSRLQFQVRAFWYFKWRRGNKQRLKRSIKYKSFPLAIAREEQIITSFLASAVLTQFLFL